MNLITTDDPLASPAAGQEANTLPPAGRQDGSLRWRAWVALVALPALLLAAVIHRFGVNVPYFDAWTGMAPLFEAAEARTLNFGHFFAQHNEHRIFVPRVIFFVVGWVTHWNVRMEMALTWAVMVAVSANLWMLLKGSGWRARGGTYAAYFAMALFCFTLMDEQNLFMGFQFSFVLPLASFTAGCWTASGLRRPWNFLATALLNTISTFTIVSGFLCWVLTIPLLLLPRGGEERRGEGKYWIAWNGAFLLAVLGYFYEYHPLAEHPGAWTMLHRADLIAEYFFAYLGAPLAFGTAFRAGEVAPFVGGCLFAGYGGAVLSAWCWRRDARFLRMTLPWLMVGAYAVANGALTTMGRARYGPAQALDSRYMVYSILLPISLLALGTVIHRQLWRTRHPWRRPAGPLLAGLAAMGLLLHILGEINCIKAWPVTRHFRLTCKALVQTINVVDEPQLLANVSPAVTPLRRTVNALDRMGMLTPPILRSASITEAGDPRDPGDAGRGKLVVVAPPAPDQMRLAGWAILPERMEPADAVLLTYDGAGGTPTIFALVEITGHRPEVAAATREPGLLLSGWERTISAEKLPADAGTIKAWAYDAEARRAFRLAGSATFATP